MIYSRAERISDAAVHVAGVLAALIAAPVIVTLAVVWFGDGVTVGAALIYALSLVAMLVCSAIYNMTQSPAWQDLLRRIDQTAIYVKIAGTYTPFAVLTGSHAGLFLTGIWGAALAGASLILFGPARLKRPSLVLYLAIGWAGVLAGQPLFSALNPAAFTLIVAGGSLYTFGVVFHLWAWLPFHNTIWHVFVLTATAVLYTAVLIELWGRAAAT
jgi:hemolysin III